MIRLLRVVWVGVAATAAIVAAGCATTVAGPNSPEEVVLQRAQARWDALVKRDWPTAYSYMAPAYRKVVPLDRFGNQVTGGAYVWEKAKVKGAKCEEKRCVVPVEITFRLMLRGLMNQVQSTYVDETWVLEDGQWYKFETI